MMLQVNESVSRSQVNTTERNIDTMVGEEFPIFFYRSNGRLYYRVINRQSISLGPSLNLLFQPICPIEDAVDNHADLSQIVDIY